MEITPIDIAGKTVEEVGNEIFIKLKQRDPEFIEAMQKRPKIKRNKKIITIGLESEMDFPELGKLLETLFLKLIKEGKVANFVRSMIVEYEKIEYNMTSLKGINNGSGWGEWYADESLPTRDDVFE